jgi:ribosomal-protein-alanine acetyltransferase
MLIRRFTLHDLARVVEIENLSFGSGAWPEEEFKWYARRPATLFLVAQVDGRVGGYSITQPLRVNAELVSLAVDPQFRGRGTGRALLMRSLQGAKRIGARSLWLMVRTDNDAAIRLYAAAGFASRGIVPGYYEDGGDARRMETRL